MIIINGWDNLIRAHHRRKNSKFEYSVRSSSCDFNYIVFAGKGYVKYVPISCRMSTEMISQCHHAAQKKNIYNSNSLSRSLPILCTANRIEKPSNHIISSLVTAKLCYSLHELGGGGRSDKVFVRWLETNECFVSN